MRRLYLRFFPVSFLSHAILRCSLGVSRLVNKEFADSTPYKNGVSNIEGALVDLYHAQKTLSMHSEMKLSLKASADHAVTVQRKPLRLATLKTAG
jgi:hypothetical protein